MLGPGARRRLRTRGVVRGEHRRPVRAQRLRAPARRRRERRSTPCPRRRFLDLAVGSGARSRTDHRTRRSRQLRHRRRRRHVARVRRRPLGAAGAAAARARRRLLRTAARGPGAPDRPGHRPHEPTHPARIPGHPGPPDPDPRRMGLSGPVPDDEVARTMAHTPGTPARIQRLSSLVAILAVALAIALAFGRILQGHERGMAPAGRRGRLGADRVGDRASRDAAGHPRSAAGLLLAVDLARRSADDLVPACPRPRRSGRSARSRPRSAGRRATTSPPRRRRPR